MDLTGLIVIGIATLGYKLNQGTKTLRHQDSVRQTISENEKPSVDNVYKSTHYKKTKDMEQAMADKNYKLSQDPMSNNIIPPNFNNINFEDTVQKTNSRQMNTNTILPGVVQKTGEQLDERKTRVFDGPMFGNTLVSSKGVPIQAVDSVSGLNDILGKDSNTLTLFNTATTTPEIVKTPTIEGFDSLTGLPMEQHHQNMVPFFGAKVTQNTKDDKNRMVLDNFTGSWDKSIKHQKKEIPNMFKPTPNNNVFGNSAYTESVDPDRFVISKLKTNLLPTPQVRVQPIPSDAIRPKFKSIDTLRSKSNQKETFEGRTVDGVSHSETRRGEVGVQNKNRPDKFYLNGEDRLFGKAPANVTGQMVNPVYTADQNSRADISSTQYNLGPRIKTDSLNAPMQYNKENFSNVKDTSVTNVEIDKKRSYKQDWVRNGGQMVKQMDEKTKSTYIAQPNERDTTKKVNLNNATFSTKSGWIFYDTAKTTTKETNLFEYSGNAENLIPAPQDYTADYNQQREPQWTSVENYKGNAVHATAPMDYTTYDNSQPSTSREDTVDLKGRMASGSRENQPIGTEDMNVRQRDNSFSEFSHSQNIGKVYSDTTNQGNFQKLTKIVDKVNDRETSDRIDPIFLKAFTDNPYTHSLYSS